MADPKLMRIMQVLATRLKTIKTVDGFNTNIGQTVERYPRVFNENECPACSLYLSSADQGGLIGTAQKTDPGVVIHASSVYVDEIAEDVALRMLTDIHKAIEVRSSSSIPLNPDIIRQVSEVSWQIIYPENLAGIVSLEVLYQFSYSRKYGED